MRQQLYRMFDSNPSGMLATRSIEAKSWNDQGWGIFLTVNDFEGTRKIQNLVKINAYAVDLDTGTKEQMTEKIRRGLTPTYVVETKRGFHVWWLVSDADPHYWNAIVLDRLVPFYGADRNARDIARVLRAPNYYHMKDPTNPFLIKTVFKEERIYTQDQMKRFYPDASAPERNDFIHRESRLSGIKGPFWERVWRLDCMEALNRISGHDMVNGELFGFIRNNNGNYNVTVNGKSTSVFIDHDFRIGSLSGGGPTLYQFIKWYGHPPGKVIDFIQEHFPETQDGNGTVQV